MRRITGLFDHRPEADLVVEHLVQEYGIDRNAVQVHAADVDVVGTASGGKGEGGLWATLKQLFVPEEHHPTYAEGLRRGAVVVSVEVEAGRAPQVTDLFTEYGAINLKEREAEWRRAGWVGS